MKKKEWAKHIINRFGEDVASRFADSVFSCPCVMTMRSCGNCDFNMFHSGPFCTGCMHARMWYLMSYKKVKRIKKLIKGLL